ncbi:TetR/AcrR family transcriptional regulator [Amycolatopsis sp. Poz14]|uniref:TetR/AcrR family transcriptional regulator n=1 Tax=Amycolatopsis sp. Poz14 TaxID=1447705 RepID=UPI001EE7A55B|nr:TetR/AcrR family transcriptional regulator [Amycolatopsis sp. Poz14]MCG3751908.1 TetR/AcrR family transcriptional regulator [Amycolatopsis sp. Poz14]
MARVEKGRPYGGKSADERRAERRAALLLAGRELWCESGWASVTMRGVCTRAGLTDRYFYESFTGRDALLVAVAESVRDEILALILEAVLPRRDAPLRVQLRAALEVVVSQIADNFGTTQIFFGEHGGSDVLESMRRDTVHAVVDMFMTYAEPKLAPDASAAEFRVALLVGIGGFVEAATAWRSKAVPMTAPELIDALMRMAERLAVGFVDLS